MSYPSPGVLLFRFFSSGTLFNIVALSFPVNFVDANTELRIRHAKLISVGMSGKELTSKPAYVFFLIFFIRLHFLQIPLANLLFLVYKKCLMQKALLNETKEKR